MKTVDYWMEVWAIDPIYIRPLIKQIQDDAFHSGQLSGLELGKKTAMETIEKVFSKGDK